VFSPLELSSDQCVAKLFAQVGRGREQAAHLYSSFIRQGHIPRDLASFANAPQLYQEMISLMDLSHDSIKVVQEDGSNTKFVLQTIDGYGVESVVMTMQRRTTLCVSSQIGCGIRCRFCKTGQAGFIRNLTVKEIVGQVFVAIHLLHKKIQNVVFMGMGEPFSNFQNVFQAIRVLTDPRGFGIAARHITIATSGDVDKIRLFAEESQGVNLAISLNAPTDELRAFLMPGRANCSLSCLRKAMEDYCKIPKREILVSYVLLGGVNDSLEMAQKVAQFLQDLPVRINLIPFNAHPSSEFRPPTDQALQTFTQCLRSHNFPVFLRKERGAKIQAACGQLSSSSQTE
jgi:23S rRNA (adenine2503-C2)-methyltransferase